MAEFRDICHERNVIGGLNELDRLVNQARERMERGEAEGAVP